MQALHAFHPAELPKSLPSVDAIADAEAPLSKSCSATHLAAARSHKVWHTHMHMPHAHAHACTCTCHMHTLTLHTCTIIHSSVVPVATRCRSPF